MPKEVTISGGVTVTGGATAAKQDTGNASLATIATQTNTSKGSGVMDATTQRVVLASDGPTVTALGTTADVAYTSGSGSMISLLKGIFTKLALWAFDNTDRQRVSLYAKSSAAGDTALAVNSSGQPQVDLGSTTGATAISYGPTMARGASGSNTLAVMPFRYSGTTQEVERNNNSNTLLASAARTTTQNATFTNFNGRGVRVDIDITAYTAGGLTPTIQCQDSVSGVWVDVLAGAKIVATGHVALEVFPGIAAVANLAASKTLARACRVRLVPDDATSITYSVAADVLV